MTYTTTAPTRAGWYWCIDTDDDRVPFVVELRSDGLFGFGSDSYSVSEWISFGYEFGERIPSNDQLGLLRKCASILEANQWLPPYAGTEVVRCCECEEDEPNHRPYCQLNNTLSALARVESEYARVLECSSADPLTDEDVGRIVIDAIAAGSMVHADHREPRVLIWNGNAPEQIGTAIRRAKDSLYTEATKRIEAQEETE